MRKPHMCIAVLATLIAGTTAATAQQGGGGQPRACAALRQVCTQAGFVRQGARAGEGLVVDCIRPIMQGLPQSQNTRKPLPAVDPQLVEACRAANPNFGMPNQAAQQQRMQRQPMQRMQQPPAMQAPQMGPPPQDTLDEPPQAPPSPR